MIKEFNLFEDFDQANNSEDQINDSSQKNVNKVLVRQCIADEPLVNKGICLIFKPRVKDYMRRILFDYSSEMQNKDFALLNDYGLIKERFNRLVAIGLEQPFVYSGNKHQGEVKGELGFSRFNPLPVMGNIGELIYLSSLVYDTNGKRIVFKKSKVVCECIDEIDVATEDGCYCGRLYFDIRYETNTEDTPKGFSKIDVIKSITGTVSAVKKLPVKNIFVLANKDSAKFLGEPFADVFTYNFCNWFFPNYEFNNLQAKKYSKYYSSDRQLGLLADKVRQYIECKLRNGIADFQWIKKQVITFSFDFLAFYYAGHAFSVIIDFVDNEGKSLIPYQQREIQLLKCEQYDLIPLCFKLCKDTKEPLSEAMDLYFTDTDKVVDFNQIVTNKPVGIMSRWELHMLAINLAIQAIEERGYAITCINEEENYLPHIEFNMVDGTVGRCMTSFQVNDHKEYDCDIMIEDCIKAYGRKSILYSFTVYVDGEMQCKDSLYRGKIHSVSSSGLRRVRLKGNSHIIIREEDNALF